ncbi:MAG TPA: hydroxyisourate hydrolase [Candidatus Limnocylindrales bacterium]
MAHEAPTISTHVLDTEAGRPAAGILVRLYRADADDERLVGEGVTDADGRIGRLLAEPLAVGRYRMAFELANRSPIFRRLDLHLEIGDATRSHHIPLLLSSYGLTTYRGS